MKHSRASISGDRSLGDRNLLRILVRKNAIVEAFLENYIWKQHAGRKEGT